jgi:hypothetical protein
MTLAEKRCKFTSLLARWITEATKLGYYVALDEARVINPRLVYGPFPGSKSKVKADDATHKTGSMHYLGLAADVNLFYRAYDGADLTYIRDGDSNDWKNLAALWESLDKSCTSGRRWGDANHLSFEEGSREGPLP